MADAGKPILLENPGYFGARKAFEAADANIIPMDIDTRGIRTDLLRADQSGAHCVYVTPSHQYPTGATLSLERRLDLIHWAAEHHKWIIEDDYDSEFHYEGLPTACVQGLDKYQRTIYLDTFSKTLYPGYGLVAATAFAIAALLTAIVAAGYLTGITLSVTFGWIGFLTGVMTPSRDMLVRAAAPKGSEGKAFGIVSTGTNIGGTIGPVVFGWLLDQGHPNAIFWTAVAFMGMTVAFTLMQELIFKRR